MCSRTGVVGVDPGALQVERLLEWQVERLADGHQPLQHVRDLHPFGRIHLQHTACRRRMIQIFRHSVNSPINTFIHAITHSFMQSFIHSLVYLFTHSFIHSCIHAFIYSSIHSCIHSVIHSFMYTFIRSFIHSAASVKIQPRYCVFGHQLVNLCNGSTS